MLHDRRPTLTPIELDRIKLRAMSATRRSTSPRKGFFMRSRLTTLLTVAFLALGTGGALALQGGGDFGFGGGDGGSASFHQYRCMPHGSSHCKEVREEERKEREERQAKERKEREERQARERKEREELREKQRKEREEKAHHHHHH
jgi:hypothetical protein